MKYIVFLFISIFFQLATANTISDCDCDLTITSNQSLPNNIANRTVCIQGNFNYTQNIQLKNKTELCIGDNVNFTGNITGQWPHTKTIYNYGIFNPNNPYVNDLAHVEFYNYGEVSATINFNQGDSKIFYNYGIFNSNTNAFRSGSFYNYTDAVLNIQNSTVFGSSINFLNEGNINVGQNLTIESNLTLGGNYTVNGNTTYNSSNIYLENARFDISGDVNIWSNVHLQTNSNNSCSQVFFSTINPYHGYISSNFGSLGMTSFPNTQNVSGNVNTDACPDDNAPILPTTTWLGNNKNFNDTSNWSNGLPAVGLNVVIPETNNNPELTSGSFSMNNLTIQSNAELFIDNAANIYTTGDLILDGILDAENGNFEFSGDENQEIEINGNADMKRILISSGNSLTISGNEYLNIHYLVTLENNSSLETNDKLSLKCKFSNNNPNSEEFEVGQIAETNGIIIGKVLVEQCYTGRRSFRMLASPVDTEGTIRENWQEDANAYNHDPNPGFGTHITGLDFITTDLQYDGLYGFDWQPSGNTSMFTFNNQDQSWADVNSTLTNLEAGKPYRLMVRGSRSIDITTNDAIPNRTKLRTFGTLHQGDRVITDLSSVANTFNLVANPYQCVVDLVQVYADSENILPYFIIWDPTLGTRGAFAAINLITLEKSNNTSDLSRFLLPQQAGFFVTATDGNAEITFKESHKNPSQNIPVVLSDTSYPNIQASIYSENLYQANEKSSDGLHISFKQNGNDGFDENDGKKMSNLDENIARFQQGELVSIEERSLPDTNTELPLYIDTFTTDEYVFEIEISDFSNHEVFLKDYYTQEEILLEDGVNTIFIDVDPNLNASTAYNRFSLLLNPISLGTNLEEINDFAIYPNPVTNGESVQINAQALAGESANINIYNTLGANVGDFNIEFDAVGSFNLNLNKLNLSSGIYIINVQTKSGKILTSKLMKK